MWFLFALVSTALGGEIVLGTASAEQLAALDDVSEAQAVAIVALAEERGGIKSVEELRVLNSMSPQTLASLRRETVVPIAIPGEGAVRKYNSAEEVLAEFRHEPDVQSVQSWASEYARLSPEMVKRWLGASKSFAALPQLTLRYQLRDGWDQDFEYATADGVAAPSAPGEDHIDVLDNAGVDQDRYYYAEARWQLSELIMSSERIRVINESQDVVKLRDKILSEVTRLYFERRRVQVENLLSPKRDTLGQVKQQIRLMELTASIDALTGGTFSQSLSTSGGSSAQSRSAPAPAAAPAPTPAPGGIDL
jgi:hypothetical protein